MNNLNNTQNLVGKATANELRRDVNEIFKIYQKHFFFFYGCLLLKVKFILESFLLF